jgi:hypothetical protein
MSGRISAVILASLCAATAAQADWWDYGEGIRGEGPVQEETRTVGKITAVELGTFGTLFIEQADSTSLSVTAQENLLEYIETDVRSGTLLIRTRSRINLRAEEPVEYHLTVPSLEDVILGSSGDVIMGPWNAERLYVSLESSGDLECDSLVCPELDVELESSGDLVLHYWQGESLRARLSSSGDVRINDGTAKDIDVDINSSGDFKADRLECARASVSTSSSGDASVRVSEYLRARTSSSGDIVYYGRPAVEGRASSSGEIVQRHR